MSIIDIIIIVLLLIFVIIGFFKGFTMKRINWFLILSSIVLGVLLGIPLARLVMNTNVGNSWLQTIMYDSLPESEIFMQNFSNETTVATDQLHSALTELKIPTFFHTLFIDQVLEYSLNVRAALASSFAYLTSIAFLVILITIVFFILLFAIIKPVWRTIFGENGKNVLGRIAGILIGVIKASAVLIVIFSIVNLVDTLMQTFNNNFIHDWLTKQLYLDNPGSFSIGKLFYHITSWLWGWITSISNK